MARSALKSTEHSKVIDLIQKNKKQQDLLNTFKGREFSSFTPEEKDTLLKILVIRIGLISS